MIAVTLQGLIDRSHALAKEGLSQVHNDPFDRALVAQTLSEGLTLVRNNRKMKKVTEIT